jgi:YVTN family beta-propeller protein
MRRIVSPQPLFGHLGLLCLILALGAPVVAADVLAPRPDGSRRERYAVPEDDLYLSPIQLALSRDGARLYVACEGTGEILIVDTHRRAVVGRAKVGRLPFGMALSPDQQLLYVSNRGDNSVMALDLVSLKVRQSSAVGDDPHGLLVDPDGSRLFVANLSTNDLCILDTNDLSEVKRLSLGTGPFDLALSPDQGTLFASNQYSNPVPFRTPPIPELTLVDLKAQLVRERRDLYSTVVAQGVAVSPDGWFAVTALVSPKNLLPESQIQQGWMVTHGFALTETRPGGRTAYLLIDEPNLYYADPYGIGFSPDGERLFLSSSGADAVTVVSMPRVYDLLQVRFGKIGISDALISRYARHLGLSDDYVLARIPTGRNPKDLVVSPDGRWVYVADRLADQITVIDGQTLQATTPIDLGGPPAVTMLRWGAELFNHASISFQRQLSCNTCHPEESTDGLIYDIAADGGMGHNLVANLTMRGIAETAPFKWRGKNPTLYRQEGPRAAQLFFRTHGFEADENEAIVRFIESIPFRPNRYRKEGARLNEFQQWGKELYERAYDNLGRYIPKSNRCITCHPPPYGTDRMTHDVGTRAGHDTDGVFESPHLNNVFQRPPYLHDGRCYSLEEIWTVFNPDDSHGVTNDMLKEQLNALIEYMKTF